MILRHFLGALRGCQDARCSQKPSQRTERRLDEAYSAAGEPTVSQRQVPAESETPSAVCRAGWAWVREYVADLREDYANRVGAP